MAKRTEIASIPQPENKATRNQKQCLQIPPRSVPSDMTPSWEILLWTSSLSPAHWKMRCNPPSRATQCYEEESSKTTGSEQPITSSVVSMFHLRVPTAEVSNSRSLCLKTTECSQRVADLLSNSLHSVKRIWKSQTNFRRYDTDKNKWKGKSS